MARFYPSGGAGGGVGSDELTATSAHVLSGKKYVGNDTNDDIGTGTMPNHSGSTKEWSGTATVVAEKYDGNTGKITVSNTNAHEGYYDKDSKVVTYIRNFSASNIKDGVLVGRKDGDETNCIKGTFTSDANAVSDNLLADKSAYVKGEKVTGTMPNHSGYTRQWSTTANVTVEKYSDTAARILVPNALEQIGYYDKSSNITAYVKNLSADNIKDGVLVGRSENSDETNCIKGTFTSDANATASNILSGKTAYVKGEKVTGTIASKGATTHYATTSDQTISAGQYLSGDQTIKKLTSSNLSAGNIKTGVTVTVNNGNTNVYSVAGTFCSDATLASAGSLLTGTIAYGKDGTKYSGSMANQGAKTSALNCGGSYTIPAGYHNGSGKITANSLSSQTGVDSGKTAVTAATMLTGYQGWVSGSKISGSMANNGAKTATYTPSTSVQTYTIPAGYHNGSGKITINAVPSKYVDFSAGVTFFEKGVSETAMFTALGTCRQRPQSGIPVSEWKTTWAYQYDEISFDTSRDIGFYYDEDENDQEDTCRGFCTKKSMDFTGIKTLRVYRGSSMTGGSTVRAFFFNVNTYVLTSKYFTYSDLTGKDYCDIDISSVSGQCLWGMNAQSNNSYCQIAVKALKFYA